MTSAYSKYSSHFLPSELKIARDALSQFGGHKKDSVSFWIEIIFSSVNRVSSLDFGPLIGNVMQFLLSWFSTFLKWLIKSFSNVLFSVNYPLKLQGQL